MRARTLASACLLPLAIVLTGCMGDGTRPSVDEVADSLRDGYQGVGIGMVDERSAECVAEAFVDSDMSDESLRAIADRDQNYEPSSEDAEAMSAAAGSIGLCVAGGLR